MIELNKIYNEDCLETMKRMEDKSVDLVVTSPPYDNLRNYNGFDFDFENTAKELFRIIKWGGVVIWVVNDATINGSETGTSFKQALYFKEVGFNLHDTMIYEKNGASYPSQDKYYQIFEYMFILSKGMPKTVNLLKDRKNLWGGSWGKSSRRDVNGNLISRDKIISNDNGIRFNIWRYNTGKGFSTKDEIAYQHPAIFPDKLAQDHIISWSNEKDIIYDPFMGSGTTAVACLNLNRNYIGSEISPEYCKIAEERIRIVNSQPKLL
jgi:site-specific DNA-methyltransferase (adenine-specific)